MKKNIKFLLLLLALMIMPVISVKADYFDTRSGYHCYLLCKNGPCDSHFLLYTNKDMTMSNFDGLTAKTDFFAPNAENRNIQSIWNERFDNPSYEGARISFDLVNESGFENYQYGSPMSPMQCAAAGVVSTNFIRSEDLELVIEEDHDDTQTYGDQPGVYEVFPNVLLFGSGFRVITPNIDASNPYDSFEDGVVARWAGAPSNVSLSSSCPVSIFSEIRTYEDFLNCYGCSSSNYIDYPCDSGIYTPGVVPEPDNAENAIDQGTDPNNVIDGHVIGGVDTDTSTYNWTCDDVKYTTFAYNTLRIVAPFLLIIFASIDYFKAVAAGDIKKQQEARSKAPKRLIAFILLLVLPFVVGWIFKTFGAHGSGVLSVFCCVATNGNQECTIDNPNRGGNPVTPTNTSQVEDVSAENLCNGSSYLTPVTVTTVCSVEDCVNKRYGECLSTNINDPVCNKCQYTALTISEDLCNSNCGIGYNGGQCFFNVRTGENTSTINNIANSGLNLIKTVHQTGTTGDYQDGYYQYDRHIKKNITQSVCTGELNGTPYDCDSTGNSCSCLYGNSIFD